MIDAFAMSFLPSFGDLTSDADELGWRKGSPAPGK
jgi:hypothetical protein